MGVNKDSATTASHRHKKQRQHSESPVTPAPTPPSTHDILRAPEGVGKRLIRAVNPRAEVGRKVRPAMAVGVERRLAAEHAGAEVARVERVPVSREGFEFRRNVKLAAIFGDGIRDGQERV